MKGVTVEFTFILPSPGGGSMEHLCRYKGNGIWEERWVSLGGSEWGLVDKKSWHWPYIQGQINEVYAAVQHLECSAKDLLKFQANLKGGKA